VSRNRARNPAWAFFLERRSFNSDTNRVSLAIAYRVRLDIGRYWSDRSRCTYSWLGAVPVVVEQPGTGFSKSRSPRVASETRLRLALADMRAALRFLAASTRPREQRREYAITKKKIRLLWKIWEEIKRCAREASRAYLDPLTRDLSLRLSRKLKLSANEERSCVRNPRRTARCNIFSVINRHKSLESLSFWSIVRSGLRSPSLALHFEPIEYARLSRAIATQVKWLGWGRKISRNLEPSQVRTRRISESRNRWSRSRSSDAACTCWRTFSWRRCFSRRFSVAAGTPCRLESNAPHRRPCS